MGKKMYCVDCEKVMKEDQLAFLGSVEYEEFKDGYRSKKCAASFRKKKNKEVKK